MIFSNNVYRLPIAKSYVSHWGLKEAVRELIQNALDSPSPFVYEIDKEDDGKWTLTLRSEHTTLTPQTLLLGVTTKTEDADSIGSFGEGYKIALLVLTRLGYPIAMYNGSRLWTPRFEHDRQFDCEMLCIHESKLDHRHSGLTYHLSGLSEQDVTDIRESCLLMQDIIGERIVTTKGEILLEKPGKLYVGSLYVCDVKMKYGYNVLPKYVRLERDRQTPHSWDLQHVCAQMWYETRRFDQIAQMIDEDVPDVYYARYDAPEMVKEACYQLFRKNNPGAIVASSQQELQDLVKRGMERVVVVPGGMHYAVSTSRSYIRAPAAKIVSPSDRLEAFLATHRFNMHEKVRGPFRDLIDEAKGWRLK